MAGGHRYSTLHPTAPTATTMLLRRVMVAVNGLTRGRVFYPASSILWSATSEPCCPSQSPPLPQAGMSLQHLHAIPMSLSFQPLLFQGFKLTKQSIYSHAQSWQAMSTSRPTATPAAHFIWFRQNIWLVWLLLWT